MNQELTCVVDTQPALEHLAHTQDLRQRPVAALQPRQALVDEQVDLRRQTRNFRLQTDMSWQC